jgi:hypothetical protein
MAQNCFSVKLKTVVNCIKINKMKVIYNTLGLIGIILLNSCAQGDKKVDATVTSDGPNVIIDSTGFKTMNNTGSVPLNPNAPTVTTNQSLVVPQQEKTVQVSSQNIQMTPAQMQQIQQQAIQNQQIQQPQQAVVSQTAAHPPFSDVEFKKMQDDAQKRGVQLNPAHGQPGHRCDIYVAQPLDSKPVPALTKGASTAATTTPTPAPQTVSVGTPQPVKTLPGMNPPHGEPGHRCDITVGQPLNSKPNIPPTQTAPAAKADSAKGGK